MRRPGTKLVSSGANLDEIDRGLASRTLVEESMLEAFRCSFWKLLILSASIVIVFKVPLIASFLRPTFQKHNIIPEHRDSKSRSFNMASWDSLSPDSLVSAPCLIDQTLCEANNGKPRFAAHKEYATSILEAWRDEEVGSDWDLEWTSLSYHSASSNNEDEDQLFGHWIRPRDRSGASHAVIFFHTGAGPHDLFLLWKAASLAHSCNVQVLIADVLSDETGWGWNSDRTQYQAVMDQLRRNGLYAGRVGAALDEVERSNLTCIGAIGFCLGGRSILELAVSPRCPPALATFHGVFSERPKIPADKVTVPQSELLICHGINDPFVPSSDIEEVLIMTQALGHKASLLQLKAKHGFSNPAQVHNPNEAFEYDAEAATKSWRQAVALLKRVSESR